MMAEEFLKVNNISKSFAGVHALQNVSFTINKGEIHCLIGENGSGKSTMIKIIAGIYEPDEGEIIIAGKKFKRLHPIDTIREGIQIIYQDFSLFPNFTVAENIALNSQLSENKKLVDMRAVRKIAREALESINVAMDLDMLVDQMSVADKQLIAISRALLQNARLIIMDEPTTALTSREVKSLFSVINNLKDKGISTMFVSHKLNEVLEIADRTMVFRNGVKVIDAEAKEFSQAKMVYYMTGHNIEEESYVCPDNVREGTPLLSVKELNSTGNFRDVSFDLYSQEIIGITGLLGSGRTELALALFGINPAESGKIILDGKAVRIKSAYDAMRCGIGYVPEDRITEGLFLERPIGQNIIATTIDKLLNKIRLINYRKMDKEIKNWIDGLNIKTDSSHNPVKSLSGGNQQRVVLAKWLASNPRILILNGPTVGVDIGSKSELHETIKSLAKKGLGVVVVSDDIPELLHVCNRILLMREGKIVSEFCASETNENDLAIKLAEG
jgi:simple sugar transport system ATP-binding protein